MVTPMMAPAPEGYRRSAEMAPADFGKRRKKKKEAPATFTIDELVEMENARQARREALDPFTTAPGEEPLTAPEPCTLGMEKDDG